MYGSVAKATDQSASDIDAMIISDSLTYGEVFGALEGVTRAEGRKVNPTVYTAAEFSKRAQTENAFVTRVLEANSLDSRFDLAYSAAHALCLAALRPTDSGRRSGTSFFRCCRTPLAWGPMSGESCRSATTCGIGPPCRIPLQIEMHGSRRGRSVLERRTDCGQRNGAGSRSG